MTGNINDPRQNATFPVPAGVKGLKRLVYAMGITLMGGMVLLVVLLYQRLPEEISPSTGEKGCPSSVVLPEGVHIEHMALDKRQLAFLIKEKDMQYVSIFDSCSGKVVQRIEINNR